MHTSITEAVLGDPIVFLELCTLVLTFAYMVKAAYLPNGCMHTASLPAGTASKEKSFENHLRTLFGVGTLISLPKESLGRQKSLGRQRYLSRRSPRA